MIEGLQKIEGSGYIGSGFKYSPEEFKAEVDKLITVGLTPIEARKEVIAKEALARLNQKEAQNEKTPRYKLAA